MSKEKVLKLSKYIQDCKNRLEGAVPEKHSKNPTTYHEFLRREIASTTKKVDELKISGSDKK